MSESPAALREVQAWFYRAVTAAVAPVEGDVQAACIHGDERMSARERLGIYAEMYAVRLREVLRTDHPKLAALLGSDFDPLAVDYVRACPPRHASVREVGDRFGDFIAGHPLARARPWLADLARLERARIEVFDAPDDVLLDLATVRALPAERFATLPLRLLAAHRVLTLDERATAAWQRIDRGDAAGAVPDDESARSWIIWRDPDPMRVHHRPLAAAELKVLPLLVSGAPFGEVCAWLGQGLGDEEAIALAGQRLTAWLDDGLLAASAP